jgi:CubicO group peptidase (beta-lactamase class C family)
MSRLAPRESGACGSGGLGLADYFNDKFMNASRARFRAIDDYFPLFGEEQLQFEPGARFRYSNAGFMVLGAIVQ